MARPPGPTSTTLGANVRREREAVGLSMRELSDRAFLGGASGGSTLGTIEGGRVKSPSAFTLYAIASALGVRMEDLMGVQRIEITTKGRRQERRMTTTTRAMVIELGSAWRANDMPAVGAALAKLEAIVGLREQGEAPLPADPGEPCDDH